MPPHLHADQPAEPEPATVEALISQARRLRGGLDAMRHSTESEESEEHDTASSAQRRWQRALCELATHQLDDVGGHLDQLREGLSTPASGWEPSGAHQAGEAHAATGTSPDPPGSVYDVPAARAESTAPSSGLPVRTGSAEWDLLTDHVTWSEELYRLFGRASEDGPLSLDELPSWVLEADRPALTSSVTDCLVDGRPIDREFRIVRPDDTVRTVHMVGEPVLDDAGTTASMWAVVRDVSELRQTERAVGEAQDSLQRERHLARAERRLAVEFQEAVLPPWRGSLRFPHSSSRDEGALELAAHYLPSATSALIGGDWYDALELPDGSTLLTAGDLTGHGVAATSGMAMLLGAVRGMAVAGVTPGELMGHLNQLLDSAAQPALGSALCCRYDPATRSLVWSQAGHPPPLLFRNGQGRALRQPEGVLLGVTSDASYGQHTESLQAGDLVVLHTDGLAPRSVQLAPGSEQPQTGADRLLDLAPRFAEARTAQACVRAVAEEFGDREREDDACVLIARVSP